jgi:hypothetical protein
VTILRTKLLFLIALTVLIVLALQGIIELRLPGGRLELGDSWWDGH